MGSYINKDVILSYLTSSFHWMGMGWVCFFEFGSSYLHASSSQLILINILIATPSILLGDSA
jgi:flagellar biosynthesis protein FliR